MARLFGFSIDDDSKKSPSTITPIPENNADGVDHYLTSGFFGSYVDIEGVYRNEFDLIKRYREMALHPEVDSAIEDIVNEAIVSDTNDVPVQIELSNLNASDGLKKKIREEFKYILDLLDFNKKSHEIYRNWYIDGRIYYHKVIDLKNPSEGIQELRYIDAMKMRYIRKMKKDDSQRIRRPFQEENPMDYSFPEIEEYFVYNPKQHHPNPGIPGSGQNQSSGNGIKFAKDSIVYCTSGLVDRNKGTTLSYLNKAIKSLNQLRMIEDSLVIYRLSRAPERRIFYIDVGNLPKVKAEQYLRDVMSRYRNKLVYDSNTGEVRDDKKHMSMLEDFWLPRREGGRGTEITTLPGGQNLGELTDIKYFQTQVYKALNVPPSRLESDKSFDLGKSEEINRDEIKFTKFVGRLRKKFSDLLHDLLKTQLILKGVIAPEDWEEMKEHIQYDFLYDNHFSEKADLDMLDRKMEVLDKLDLYVGKYFSQEYVMRQLLQFTEKEIEEMKEQINNEIKAGQVIDPLDQIAQEKQTADLELETQRAQIDQMKNPPAPKTSGNSNTK